jgi:serine/threonine protein kinase
MLSEKGQIKVTDFGLVKQMGAHEGPMSTFCGALEYLALELGVQRPSEIKIEWLAVVILAYELLFGRTPFYHENLAKIFRAICSDEPKFPPSMPNDVVVFINMLLEKATDARRGFDQIKLHRFFARLDFAKVFRTESIPVFVRVTDGVARANINSEFTAAAAKAEEFEGFTF